MVTQSQTHAFTLGIDATNIRGGGGLTHLVELLRSARPELYGIGRVVVWGGRNTLTALEDRPWLAKIKLTVMDKGLLHRTFWQCFLLSRAARNEGCDLLFVPGGSYVGNFHTMVTMSQNLLPFEVNELRRFGWTLITLKILLLRLTQSYSFQKADGVIFLTEYARDVVLQVIGNLRGQTCIVPHGLNSRFKSVPKQQRAITDYDDIHPYRVLYVSIIDQYKHQWNVVDAVATLRKQGFPIALDLVGASYPPALQRLNAIIKREDPERHWVHYHGVVAFDSLHHHYAQADLGLFASSCENMPNILLETMGAGLPIACSNKGPMPEMLGKSGVYFDPEQPDDIARALHKLIESPILRSEFAQESFNRAKQYSWQRCADETFGFLAAIMQQQKRNY